eukprot:CAMPEP_0195652628 /NCGR_PEP_ID=MMETSP0815-20121206/32932_1 /TAXON_ID=97485 /ORGANISM="Prymnesium parvum, Strain Texoma1" /LENGTH=580 /DNA_ID=CAMNT_0040796673 /DNA_START=11 /DNA_END=1750 /DNA_ORIENTATION=+
MLTLLLASLHNVAPAVRPLPVLNRFGKLPPPSSPSLLEAVARAAREALTGDEHCGKERDGSWCEDSAKAGVIEACRGLRGQKQAWWLSAPRPLRSVTSSGDRYEVSIVCLPGGQVLPAAAYPSGSVLICQPLLGKVVCRRLRLESDGKKPVELMNRQLMQGAKAPLMLFGGSCLEWSSAPGIASAFLQVVLLPPTSRLPKDCGIGWSRPPTEGCNGNEETVLGAVIQVTSADDLLKVSKPVSEEWWEAQQKSGPPEDAPSMLNRLRNSVGGLDAQLATVVRRALASRLYPPALTRELGLSPVCGMLLYGPPGCGKTLLAREIAAALGAREPKIVNGPEMMSKYVGESESFIRNLFAEAELEQAERGDESALHVIVLDELDAFARERGSLKGDTSGIRDSVINQLLAKMDGVEALDNILVVGLTNRMELIDPALLRSGRLEVHVRVDLPDLEGRQQIINIHSAKLRSRGCLDVEASAALGSGALAAATKGYSGAEIAGLLRSACSFTLERYVDDALLEGWTPGALREDHTKSRFLEVTLDDIRQALNEMEKDNLGSQRRLNWLRRRWKLRTLERLTRKAIA